MDAKEYENQSFYAQCWREYKEYLKRLEELSERDSINRGLGDAKTGKVKKIDLRKL